MPASDDPTKSAVDKLEDVRECLPDLEDIGAKHDELDLLNEVLGDSEYQALAEVYDILSMQMPEKETDNVGSLVQDILEDIDTYSRPPKHAREMKNILNGDHFKCFLEAYDDIVSKAYDSDDDDNNLRPLIDEMVRSEKDDDDRRSEDRQSDDRRSEEGDRYRDEKKRHDDGRRNSDKRRSYSSYIPPSPVYDQYAEKQRFIILKKAPNEPLGITVRQDDNDDLVISKIRQNSLADKQSRLEIGDKVKEVNGEIVFTPEDLMAVLKDVEEWIIIKIVPQHIEQSSSKPYFLRACVNYNPMTDRLIPYKKVGLSYNIGDVITVLDDADENWWQAQMADDPNGPVGLIPSRALQEKRQVFVQPETTKSKSSLLCGMGKKKKKIGYDSTNAGEYEDGHVKIYDEVALSETFRPLLVLVGVDSECKRTLKERLLRDFPLTYTSTVPETSRPMKPKDKQGRGYVFMDPDDMKADMRKNAYIEDGEYNGHMYGLRLSAIEDQVQSSKTCVLDVDPKYLKTLMVPEFRPLVLFLAAPRWESVRARNRHRKGRRINNNRDEDDSDDNVSEEKCREREKESTEMKDRYRRNFDEIFVNDDIEHTYQNILSYLQGVTSRDKKWVKKYSRPNVHKDI